MKPDNNLTFTQFFTKLLKKVPQVDLERLPEHFLTEILSGKKVVEDHEENNFSLEQHDSKTKDYHKKLQRQIESKKTSQESTDPLKVSISMTDTDEEIIVDSDGYTDYNDLNYPEEDMLDTTVTDEFTEESTRDQCFPGFEGEKKEIYLQEKDEPCFVEESNEGWAQLDISAATDIDQDCVELVQDLNETDVTNSLGDMLQNEDERINIWEVNNDNTKYIDKIVTKNNMGNLKEVCDSEVIHTCSDAKRNLNQKLGCETHVELEGGSHVVDSSAVKSKHTEENAHFVTDNMVINMNLEHTSNIEVGNCEVVTSNECKKKIHDNKKHTNMEEYVEKTKVNCKTIKNKFENGRHEREENNLTCVSLLEMQVNTNEEDITFESNKFEVVNLKNFKEVVTAGLTKVKHGGLIELKTIKEINIEEELRNEPPALKIRIFKGHTGELINEKEAKRIRKRKKKMEKQKVKKAKLTSDKDSSSIYIEKNTKKRIVQELPRCNWLEEKIKSASIVEPLPRLSSADSVLDIQVDELLGTDSDDECLVVDDKHDDKEFSTNFKQHEDTNINHQNYDDKEIKLSKNQEVFNTMTNTDKIVVSNETKDVEVVEEVGPNNCSEEEANQEIHPISYMIGNLFKRMDDNHTITGVGKEAGLEEANSPIDQHLEKIKRKHPPMKTQEAGHLSQERSAESKVGQENAQTLHLQKQVLDNRIVKEKLQKDIEDLKNKKIKEMEDLIEIKSKKEQSMTDLEKLKLEIEKNKTFLESLKRINVTEKTCKLKSLPTTCNEMFVNENVQTPGHAGRSPGIKQLNGATKRPQITDKHLPDLVNHEKAANKEPQNQVVPDHLQHLNISQDYLNHLKKIQETKTILYDPSGSPTVHTTQHTKNKCLIKNKVVIDLNHQLKYDESTITNIPTNIRPYLSIHGFQNSERHKQVPKLLKNSTTQPDKYGTNIHKFFSIPSHSGKSKDYINQQRPPTEKGNIGINQTASIDVVQRQQAESKVERGHKKTITNLLEGCSISTAPTLNTKTNANSTVNNSNGHSVINFQRTQLNPAHLPTTPHLNQPIQEIRRNINFPEIRNAIAAAIDRRDQEPNVKNVNTTQQQLSQQNQNTNLLSKCAVCYKVANFLCSGCEKVYYCTIQCQGNHWLSHYAKCSSRD